jgi:hypothetical protein
MKASLEFPIHFRKIYIAQGPGAVAAGERGVAVGGHVQGSTIVTGDANRSASR